MTSDSGTQPVTSCTHQHVYAASKESKLWKKQEFWVAILLYCSAIAIISFASAANSHNTRNEQILLMLTKSCSNTEIHIVVDVDNMHIECDRKYGTDGVKGLTSTRIPMYTSPSTIYDDRPLTMSPSGVISIASGTTTNSIYSFPIGTTNTVYTQDLSNIKKDVVRNK